MKKINKLLFLVIICFFALVRINAEEKSELYQKNYVYCTEAGQRKQYTIEGCYKEDSTSYEDLTGIESAWYNVKKYFGASVIPLADSYEVKSAKFMQAYTVMNNDEKIVLGRCYKGYIKNWKQTDGCLDTQGRYFNEIVKDKDSEHNIEVIILTVTEPQNNNTCNRTRIQFVVNGKLPGHHGPDEDINTPDYNGYKNGSCPQFFTYSSNLDGLGLILNPDLEYLFTDSKKAKVERSWIEKVADSFIKVDLSNPIGGCTQKDVEEEDKSEECFKTKLSEVTDYTCPANVKDFNLKLGNFEEECTSADKYAGYAYSTDYAVELKEKYTTKIKNAYAEKIEECGERSCKLTDSERSAVKAKMKGYVCEFGCKLAVYETESSVTEGKCIACGSSQGLVYYWRNKDYQPSGNCGEVQLSHDKCLGNTTTQACSDCYTSAYSGLSDDKKACLLNILSEKAEKIQEYKDAVDEQYVGFVEDITAGTAQILEDIWNFGNSIFILPGLNQGGFGEKGQSCDEVAQNNVIKIIKGAVNVVRIFAAIIAIANAMIMLVPAVIAKDADGLNKAGRKLVIMAVVLAIIGVLPTIVYIIGRMFGYDLSCLF